MSKPRRHDPNWVEKTYEFLADEDEGRVCKAIDEKACRVVPGNFFRFLASHTLTKIGDRLASAKTTLAWIMQGLGAPGYLIGLLVPIRESGSLLPQLLIAAFVRRQPVRKWLWVGGSLVQGAAVLGIALAALSLEGVAVGWTLLGLLALFSLARGFCSIASKDVQGKTIPKTRRGLLNGWASTASGLITLVAGAGLLLGASLRSGEVILYALLLVLAGALWLAAAGIFATMREFPGETEGGANAIKHALSKLSLLREEPTLRRFITVRALAIGSGMSAPFIIALAHGDLGGALLWLGVFIIADGLAAMASGPVLGKLADRSSRRLLVTALFATSALGITTVVWSLSGVPEQAHRFFYPILFFLLGLVHSATRLGRKTYLVDMAEGNRRTDFVAVSNTLIGMALILGGLLSSLAALFSPQAAILLFAAAALVGALLGMKLKEVSGNA